LTIAFIVSHLPSDLHCQTGILTNLRYSSMTSFDTSHTIYSVPSTMNDDYCFLDSYYDEIELISEKIEPLLSELSQLEISENKATLSELHSTVPSQKYRRFLDRRVRTLKAITGTHHLIIDDDKPLTSGSAFPSRPAKKADLNRRMSRDVGLYQCKGCIDISPDADESVRLRRITDFHHSRGSTGFQNLAFVITDLDNRSKLGWSRLDEIAKRVIARQFRAEDPDLDVSHSTERTWKGNLKRS